MERTSTTSSLRLATREGLFDELGKIASALGDERRAKFKRWAKNTAIMVGGVGAGALATTAIDKLVGAKVAPHWKKLNPTTQKAILGGLLGLTTVGAGLARKKVDEERMKTHE